MKICERNPVERPVWNSSWIQPNPRSFRPSYLSLLTADDLQDLREHLARRMIPADFDAKLARLAKGDLQHHFIEENCRTIIELLMAVQEGSLEGVNRSDFEQLLRVLAYVRKEDDAIPDHRPNGFTDDQQELRAALTELAPLMRWFKGWRLRYQVPALWQALPCGR